MRPIDPKHSLPERAHPAHHAAVDSNNRSTIVFVTICTKNRTPWLANKEAHHAITTAWSHSQNWIAGKYVLLPDHIHLFCAPGIFPTTALKAWVSYWKRLATVKLREHIPDFTWQRDFWDTQLRKGDSYSEKWAYVQNNPVRHKLVEKANDWPHQGEMNALHWHD